MQIKESGEVKYIVFYTWKEDEESMKNLIKKYDVDGVVMHSNRSCKPYSFVQYDLQKMIRDRLNIPTLILEADMVDERNFSESQVESRIDAFMEIFK